MTMNANVIVNGIGSLLQGFFEFCEKNNGIKATVLSNLFEQYFNHPSTSVDNDTCIISTKKVTKSAATKDNARKSSGVQAIPREQQTPITFDQMNKCKLVELKPYLKERGIRPVGVKATQIEALIAYEKQYETSDGDDDVVINHKDEEEDISIQVKKPKKNNGNKLCEPATKEKYTIENRHGFPMIFFHSLNGYLVLDDDNIVIGWVSSDDVINVDVEDTVPMRALTKEGCLLAKKNNIKYNVPENLDT